jgi:hypothetical protein
MKIKTADRAKTGRYWHAKNPALPTGNPLLL